MVPRQRQIRMQKVWVVECWQVLSGLDEIIRGLNPIKGRILKSPQKKTFPFGAIARIVIVLNDIGGSPLHHWTPLNVNKLIRINDGPFGSRCRQDICLSLLFHQYLNLCHSTTSSSSSSASSSAAVFSFSTHLETFSLAIKLV